MSVDDVRRLHDQATPGPWRYDGPYWLRGGDVDPIAVECISAGDDRELVCLDAPPDEAPAGLNLPLIAAAPRLAFHLARIAEAAQTMRDKGGTEGWLDLLDALAWFEKEEWA